MNSGNAKNTGDARNSGNAAKSEECRDCSGMQGLGRILGMLGNAGIAASGECRKNRLCWKCVIQG